MNVDEYHIGDVKRRSVPPTAFHKYRNHTIVISTDHVDFPRRTREAVAALIGSMFRGQKKSRRGRGPVEAKGFLLV